MTSSLYTALHTHTGQQQRTDSSPDGITALEKYTLPIFYLNDRAESAYTGYGPDQSNVSFPAGVTGLHILKTSRLAL